MRLALFLACLGMSSLPGLPAAADGIAIMQAPEQWSGHQRAETPEAGFAELRAACVAAGVDAQDCLATHWCEPGGWTVIVAVLHPEGLHWSEAVCGLPGRPMAEAVGASLCLPGLRGFIPGDCRPVLLIDPEGNELPLD